MKNLAALVAAAHANSAAHGFWGLWKPIPASEKFETTAKTLVPVCRKCETGGLISFVEIEIEGRFDAAWPAKCSRCDSKDDPSQRDIDAKIVLIHSEISEALEEVRMSPKDRGGELHEILWRYKLVGGRGYGRTNVAPKDQPRFEPQSAAAKSVEAAKPEGFIVELADCAIRCFDLLGWILNEHPRFVEVIEGDYLDIALDSPRPTLFGELKMLHKLIAMLGDDLDPEKNGLPSIRFITILRNLERLAQRVWPKSIAFEPALRQAIDLKIAYNAGRPAMHGKTI